MILQKFFIVLESNNIVEMKNNICQLRIQLVFIKAFVDFLQVSSNDGIDKFALYSAHFHRGCRLRDSGGPIRIRIQLQVTFQSFIVIGKFEF